MSAETEDDCVAYEVYVILAPSERCSYKVNPKRPTWRCKQIATKVYRDPITKTGFRLCEEHRDDVFLTPC